ncbi:MAG: DUF5050 domain-containing protein [Clostridia bacterium]|nr:DUF5050 domain-containing protein [Clostridia bacterium]
MKNLMSKKMIIAIVAVVLVVVAIVTMCSANKKTMIPADSVIAGAEGYFYYNDTKNNVVRKTIFTGEAVVIAENATFLDAYMDQVVIKKDNLITIVTSEGENTDFSFYGELADVQLTYDYIYYKEADTGHISRIVRETGDKESVIAMAVTKYILHENRILFTTDGKMLFVYDLETKLPMGYFGDKAIVDFDADEDYVVYCDAAQGYKVFKINLETGKENIFEGVKSKTIEYKNGRLFYLDNAGTQKAAYKLLVNTDDVH